MRIKTLTTRYVKNKLKYKLCPCSSSHDTLNLMSKMRSYGAAMLASRCLKYTYVIHRSLYTWFQLALSALERSQC